MSLVVLQIRGDSVTEDARVMPAGVITVDTDRNEIRLHDGVTAGGHRILNISQLQAYSSLEFDAVRAVSTPGALADDSGSKFIQLTASGTFSLPALSNLDVGQGLWIQATAASVTLEPDGSEQFEESNATSTSMAMIQNQQVRLAKKSATRWIVLHRG